MTIEGIHKPYYRIYRAKQKDDGYILDRRYAGDRYLLCRAYKILEEDLVKLFHYIEPADENKNVFSHRIYELILRAATEFETNCKQILVANNYSGSPKNWDITDYQKIEQATKLSQYEIKLNIWYPMGLVFQPLSPWATQNPLEWYNDYNTVKHHRSEKFQKATLINAVHAVGAVLAVLFAQFSNYVFEPYNESQSHDDDNDGFEYLTNTLFSIKPFKNWKSEEAYTFRWPNDSDDPFQAFNFQTL